MKLKTMVKNIATAAIVLLCCLVLLSAFIIYRQESENIRYTFLYRVQMNLEDARLSCLGDSYGIHSREGYGYYRLCVVMENPMNLGVEESMVNLTYDTGEDGGEIWEIEQDGTEKMLTEREYFPAGQRAVCFRILEIPEGCGGFDVLYGYPGDEKQKIHVTVSQA